MKHVLSSEIKNILNMGVKLPKFYKDNDEILRCSGNPLFVECVRIMSLWETRFWSDGIRICVSNRRKEIVRMWERGTRNTTRHFPNTRHFIIASPVPYEECLKPAAQRNKDKQKLISLKIKGGNSLNPLFNGRVSQRHTPTTELINDLFVPKTNFFYTFWTATQQTWKRILKRNR